MIFIAFIFLVLYTINLALQTERNNLMADNNSALVDMTAAVNAAVAALQDLAAKAKAGEDISGPLETLAQNLQAAVAINDPPAPQPPAPAPQP